MLLKKDICIRDPYIYFENETYYLYASMHFQGDKYPSFVVYTSKDLENFNEPKVVFSGYDGFWATKDYWAPEMHKYNDKYYLFVSLKAENKCRATHILVSDKPDGLFVPNSIDPVTPKDWESLDGTLYVKNGTPYMIFCHEWLQVDDGEICAIELSKDLKEAVGEPKLLFKGSDLKWIKPIVNPNYVTKWNSFVTDGPFLFERNNKLNMIWSTYSQNGYSVALSTSDDLLGKWEQYDTPLFDNNGGHGMIFEQNGRKKLVIHVPNDPNGLERFEVFDLEDLIQERGL